MPIEHVVIIVKENHTFDNYFATFPGANGADLHKHESNPPPDDPDHRHEAWLRRAGDSAHRVAYAESDIPGYFPYAREFTVCDNYFSEVAGPSTPNHLMLICADSPGINNPHHHYRPSPTDVYDLSPWLPTRLEQAFVTWDDWGGWFDHVEPPVVEKWDHRHAQRSADAFPQFDGQPFRYGSRVPCLVLSPYARKGHVSHQLNSHVSLLKFCTTMFGLRSITERDQGSNGMTDCFDFKQQPLPAPHE